MRRLSNTTAGATVACGAATLAVISNVSRQDSVSAKAKQEKRPPAPKRKAGVPAPAHHDGGGADSGARQGRSHRGDRAYRLHLGRCPRHGHVLPARLAAGRCAEPHVQGAGRGRGSGRRARRGCRRSRTSATRSPPPIAASRERTRLAIREELAPVRSAKAAANDASWRERCDQPALVMAMSLSSARAAAPVVDGVGCTLHAIARGLPPCRRRSARRRRSCSTMSRKGPGSPASTSRIAAALTWRRRP